MEAMLRLPISDQFGLDKSDGHQCCQAANEYEWAENDMGRAIIVRCLETVNDIATGGDGESRL